MGQSSDPLFTVVIPTRERPRTLPYALQSVLTQSGGEDIQVIVSDNASADNTRDVVAGMADPRIQYVNTGKRLGIADSFEFALRHAVGRYVLFIGDDDALVPGAIARLRELVRTDPTPIYHWEVHCYRWPTPQAPALIDVLIPRTEPRVLELREMAIQSLRWGGFRYRRLPLVYHGCTERALLDRLREQTGRVFHSSQQDVCLAFVLPALCPRALHVGEALVASGQSEPAFRAEDAHDPTTVYGKRLAAFVREIGDYKFHPTMYPEVPAWFNLIPDAMLVALEMFPDAYPKGVFNYSAMWAWMQEYWRYETPAWVLSRSRRIRRYQPFSAREFLFYTACHRGGRVRRAVKGLAAGRRTSGPGLPVPETVVDFVNSVAQGN